MYALYCIFPEHNAFLESSALTEPFFGAFACIPWIKGRNGRRAAGFDLKRSHCAFPILYLTGNEAGQLKDAAIPQMKGNGKKSAKITSSLLLFPANQIYYILRRAFWTKLFATGMIISPKDLRERTMIPTAF